MPAEQIQSASAESTGMAARNHAGGGRQSWPITGRHAVRQLHEQAEGARFLLAAEGTDRDERKQQRDRDIRAPNVGTSMPSTATGRLPGRATRSAGARLAVKRDRLEKTVPDEGTRSAA